MLVSTRCLAGALSQVPPKEEPPRLSGFTIPEITEDLNLDDWGYKIKELEALSPLLKMLRFWVVLRGVTTSASAPRHRAAAAGVGHTRYGEHTTPALEPVRRETHSYPERVSVFSLRACGSIQSLAPWPMCHTKLSVTVS